MSDCEETDLFWATLISPGKRKRKKFKKCKKKEEMDEKVERKKKKKNSKFKEAMAEKKRIKKEKKKKKNRSALQLDDEEKPRTSTLSKHSSDELKPDKKKRKKKVSFDSSPGIISAKRPKFVPSSSQRPKESVLLEDDAVSGGEFTASGQTHDNDSQLNSENINSQDLFITQKTFRASPSEPSSGEASDEVIPRTLSPQIERHLEGSYEPPRDSHLHQRHGKTDGHVKPRTLLTQEDKRSNKVHHEHKKGKFMDEEDKKVPCPPVDVKPRVVNPFLDDPFNVTPSLHDTKTSTSTQTENLFTTELSSYLNFCRRATEHSDDLKPLDLSLPQRARKVLGTVNREDPNPHPSGAKDVAEKKEPSSRHRRSLSARGKSKTSQSLQLESEKCAETTNSSEDNEPTNRSGKLELTQARAVQTKLNESFFFKTKGDGRSPRPESPLMKLAQGRDAKTRKGRVT